MLFPRILLRSGAGQPGVYAGTIQRAVSAPSPFASRAFFSSTPSALASPSLPCSSATASSLLFHISRRRLTSPLTASSITSTRFSSTTKALPRKFPERILIYHAGTPRTTFLACLKVTTLFGLAFFTFLVAPAYIAAGKPLSHILAIVSCGIVPFSVIAYTSLPFVVFIHLRLPAFARHPDPELLRRFVRNIPAGTKLDITTMNLIGRPRVTSVPVSDIVPAHERFRIVNFIDTRQSALAPPPNAAAPAAPAARYPPSRARPVQPSPPVPQTKFIAFSSTFPWIHLRQPTHFGAPAGSNSRGVKDGWAWEELLAIIVKRRAAQQQQSIATK